FRHYSIDICPAAFYAAHLTWAHTLFRTRNSEGKSMADNKPKAMTKTATYQKLADATGMNRKQVAEFFDAVATMIQQELGKKGPGVVTIPGLLKIKRVEKPASKASP